MEQSATCRPLCDFFEHLQEASQDTSHPVVIQPLTFFSVFNQLLRALEVVADGTLNLTFLSNYITDQMMSFPMTLSDRLTGFQGQGTFQRRCGCTKDVLLCAEADDRLSI